MSRSPGAGRGGRQLASETCWRRTAAVRRPLLIFLLRFCADEDDADDDLAEEHVTKVGDECHVVLIKGIVRHV